MRTSLSAIDQIPDGGATEVEAEVQGVPESLILVREGMQVAAFLNICPHAGRRLDWAPGRFLIDKGRLVCAAHGATFERMSGECVAGPCRGQSLRAVAVEVRDGQIWLAEPHAR
ncbi:nitrite reductase/ring-hydroxylating ferredoxin subunit [Rehaibacterium terrae]|uniref:Nitrite reductase/ring-hydroxylating ferredoxin subunit n=1 Tax=Rehaibacterium terrae TaxID=1341696 RepID=A0A7W7XZ06_9GAMM|nr:nitrite reductase/ring-hydroxylating ferredoxin subunit [Rehaibacterium terrae]